VGVAADVRPRDGGGVSLDRCETGKENTGILRWKTGGAHGVDLDARLSP